MRILAVIPARGGSKGVPGKNIKLLGGKPLIYYTIASAKESAFINDIIISTDTEEIANVAAQAGAEVPFMRPSQLASDTSSSVDVVIHAVNELAAKGRHYDAVCLLQPTTPFRQNNFIDKAIQKFVKEDTDSLISVLKVPDEYNPHWVFIKDHSGLLSIATGEKEIIRRRQDLPPSFFRDGSVYLTKISSLLNKNSLYGDSISYIENDPNLHVNIDTAEDWIKAAKLLSKGLPNDFPGKKGS